MGTRPVAKSKPAKKAAKSSLPIEADERHQSDVDEFIAQNRDALNDSIRRSRKEIGEGKHSSRSIDDIIADGRRRAKRSP